MRFEILMLTLVLATPRTTADRDLPPPPAFPGAGARSLFASDFRDGTAGWHFDHPEYWSVKNGTLCASLPDRKQVHSIATAGSADWTDYALDLDLCGLRGVDRGAAVRTENRKGIGVDLRGPGYDDILLHADHAELGRAPVSNANGRWHHLRIEARGHRYRVFVNGRLVLDRRDRVRAHASGGIALAAYTGGAGECRVCFANVRVTALR